MMCGICGIYCKRKIEPHEITKMTNLMIHRGPDAQGQFIEKVNEKEFISFGHRRLSIIDLSERANQPMTDENNMVSIVFNGEIYNFIEIRKELKKSGFVFKTSSDTEVLLTSYLKWGLDFLKKINGMFSIGIWDRKKKQLVLARDRLGIKPLYYFKNNEIFAFASELKALTILPELKKEIDYISLNDYFSLQYIPTPRTIFKDVFKLRPGHYLIYENNKISIEKYWDLDYSTDASLADLEEIKYQLKKLVEDSVKKRMISDVPLGAFLSGGIDSSIIVATMAKLSPNPIKTFTIGFNTKGFKDEVDLASITSKKYGTEHHEEILSFNRLVESLPELVYQMDEPFADHSIIPTYLVSQVARKKVTVALSGDGGDENFGGYPRKYLFAKYFGFFERFPGLSRKIIQTGINLSLDSIIKAAHIQNRRLRRIKEIVNTTGDEQLFSPLFLLTRYSKQQLYSKEFKDAINDSYRVSIFHKGESFTSHIKEKRIQWAMCHDLKNYLVDDILTKVDRMSMLNSLEVRVPFLDHRIVELGLKIPVKYKIRKHIGKWILKETFKGLISEKILNATKHGFGIPIEIWGKNKLNNFVKEVLLDEKAKGKELFNKRYLKKIMENTRWSNEKWGLVVFEIWAKKYIN